MRPNKITVILTSNGERISQGPVMMNSISTICAKCTESSDREVVVIAIVVLRISGRLRT